MFFHPVDNHIEDHPSDDVIAKAVDQHEASPGPQDAAHLVDNRLLVRIVMEGIAAGYHIKRAIVKWQVLAICGDERKGAVNICQRIFGVGHPAHGRRIIQADHPGRQ